MSDATTGVPAANASVSTMPNDSPPSDGATRRSASRSAWRLRSSETLPSAWTPRVVEQHAVDLVGRRADDLQLDGQVLAQRLEGAQQHRQPLALDRLADEDELQRLPREALAA